MKTILQPQPVDAFLDSIYPDLIRVFRDRPRFGTAGLNCVFHEGKLVRIELSASVAKQVSIQEHKS
jgi:hypothetical protein